MLKQFRLLFTNLKVQNVNNTVPLQILESTFIYAKTPLLTPCGRNNIFQMKSQLKWVEIVIQLFEH